MAIYRIYFRSIIYHIISTDTATNQVVALHQNMNLLPVNVLILEVPVPYIDGLGQDYIISMGLLIDM